MQEIAKLFISGEAEKDQEAMILISHLGYAIKPCSDGLIMKGVVLLPFVEMPDGCRRFGIDSIRQAVQERRW